MDHYSTFPSKSHDTTNCSRTDNIRVKYLKVENRTLKRFSAGGAVLLFSSLVCAISKYGHGVCLAKRHSNQSTIK